jgi:hypothetical protein
VNLARIAIALLALSLPAFGQDAFVYVKYPGESFTFAWDHSTLNFSCSGGGDIAAAWGQPSFTCPDGSRWTLDWSGWPEVRLKDPSGAAVLSTTYRYHARGWLENVGTLVLDAVTTENKVEIPVTFFGSLYLEVRAIQKRQDGTEQSTSYAHCLSTEFATVDGAPRPWRVVIAIRPPESVLHEVAY